MIKEWNLEIVKGNNGYRVNWLEELDDDECHLNEMVFEEADTEDGELEAMKNLLYFVKEHFGVLYSKHNAKNLVIEVIDYNTPMSA